MSTPSTRLLIADDQRDVLEALRLLLKAEGYQIDAVESPAAVLKALEQRDYDVVIIDLNYARDTTSGQEGLELLTKIHGADEMLPVVVMTAWGSVNVAVEAMRRGARDFVEKPWDNERLKAIVRTQAELGRALRRATRLEAQSRTTQNDGGPLLIADSAAMHPVLQIIARVGPSDANVLITGENGTGKGVVAQALHAVSPRANRPMVTINAGGVSEGVFESELFGHVKGAFTGALERRVGRFELADGGTIFLDEIGELPPETQVKLLRVLQEQEFEPVGSNRSVRVNVRVIAATNRDLPEAIRAGRFRADLFYRLNVLPIEVPPLRSRRADIPQLVTFFLAGFVKKFGKRISAIAPETMARLTAYAWPGNIRELQNIVERAVVLCEGPVLELDQDLAPISRTEPPGAIAAAPDEAPEALGHAGPGATAPPEGGSGSTELPTLEEAERRHIVAALERTGGVIHGPRGAARILDLHPNTLRSRMERLGIKAPRPRPEPS
jgi:DNA-binding NtrC family response regulator